MTGLLQISPGRRMEGSCRAIGYHLSLSRKHSRFPMWWKRTLETTAARPPTGWVPHTTSLRSPSKVCNCDGAILEHRWKWKITVVWILHLSSPRSGSILGQRSEEPGPRAEWDGYPDLPSRRWPQTEDYLVYQRRLYRKWVKLKSTLMSNMLHMFLSDPRCSK